MRNCENRVDSCFEQRNVKEEVFVLKMNSRSLWVLLFVALVLSTGGCGGGGGGGGSGGTPGGGGGGGGGISSTADMFNGTWKTTECEFFDSDGPVAEVNSTLVITPLSNSSTNSTAKRIRLTSYVHGEAVILEYDHVTFSVSSHSGYVTMEGIANRTDYVTISGNSSALYLSIIDGEGNGATGNFTRTSTSFSSKTTSESDPEFSNIGSLITDSTSQ
jgi:hypothetical protein